MTTEPQQYSIPAGVTMTQLAEKIRGIFSAARTFKSTSDEINAELSARITGPLNYRTPGGRRKHSSYLLGYAQGVIDSERENLFRNYLEFCYLVDGELYSTHRQPNTTRRTTNEFYGTNRGHVLNDAPHGFYWKDSDKRYC